MKHKTVDIYEDHGFGFKIRLVNAPMIQVRKEWVLNVDQNKLQKLILLAVARKPVRLTGDEVYFVRHYFDMTLQEFGAKFDVSHVAVKKWEAAGSKVTNMAWSTEKDLRLMILARLKVSSKEFFEEYQQLEEVAEGKPAPIEVDVKKIA